MNKRIEKFFDEIDKADTAATPSIIMMLPSLFLEIRKMSDLEYNEVVAHAIETFPDEETSSIIVKILSHMRG